jgi:hypothetical protein
VPRAINLSRQEARRFMLAHQRLLPPRAAEGKEGVLDYIRRVGCIQFDPLNIVGCNHELVLQSRVKDFRRAMLQDLLYQDRRYRVKVSIRITRRHIRPAAPIAWRAPQLICLSAFDRGGPPMLRRSGRIPGQARQRRGSRRRARRG